MQSLKLGVFTYAFIARGAYCVPCGEVRSLQVLARNGRAAVTIVQEGALPALAKTAGEGLSERAQVNATKVWCHICTLHKANWLRDHEGS